MSLKFSGLSVFRRGADQRMLFDNTRMLARIASRRQYYWNYALRAAGRIPVQTMLRSHFAFNLPTAPAPAYCTVEFTNYCNLACSYCTSPLGLRTRGMMSEGVFESLLAQLSDLKVPRVRIVGNGESTLHPRFCSMVRRLGATIPFVQMVSNGQRYTDEIIDAILLAPVRLLEISVDGKDQTEYERTRIGGSLQNIVDNIGRIRSRRAALRSPTMINSRVMINPDRRKDERDLLAFWRSIADTAMPQYLITIAPDGSGTVFEHAQSAGTIPRCSVTLKSMNVQWNGTVPLCGMSFAQSGLPEGLLVGSVTECSLREMWNGPLMTRYRSAHREQLDAPREMCRGCVGG